MSFLKGASRDQLLQLDKETLVELLVAADGRISELEQVMVAYGKRVQQLEDQVAKNSQNSGKPPSSDGLKKPRTRSLRQKGARKGGGQKGHEGHSLKMVETPEHQVVHALEACPHCEQGLGEVEAVGWEKRQVFDLPVMKLEVTEHQAEIKVCPHCRQEGRAAFPPEVKAPVQYGPRIKSQAVYFHHYQLLSLARTCETFEDLYAHRPTEALVIEAGASFVDLSQATQAWIKEQLIRAEVAHFDETGLRVEGKLAWVHVACTPQLTCYTVQTKRGQAGMRQMGILPLFCGRAIHDHFSSYYRFTDCLHGLCNAHHLRQLQFITDQYQQPWAQEMTDLLLAIKAEVEAAPPSFCSLSPSRHRYFERQYDRILQEGYQLNPPPQAIPNQRGRPKQSPSRNLLNRLADFKLQTLAFMYDFRVPFTNNLAERDVRMVKVKQKISGSFRTLIGAETFCAIRSYISTIRKHGLNVIDAIYLVFSGQPYLPACLDPPT